MVCVRLTQKEHITGRITNELDERLLHEATLLRIGRYQINRTVHRKHCAQLGHLNQLSDLRFAPKTGQTVVPDCRKQLLDVWMCDKLQNGTTDLPKLYYIMHY